MLELAVANYLLNNAGVAALVGARGYVQVLPQSADYPAFRVQLIDEVERGHLRGGATLRPARVQVDAVGEEADGMDTYGEVLALANAINAALMNQPPIVTTVTDGASPAVMTTLELKVVAREANPPIYDPQELSQFKIGQDFLIWARVLP